MKTIVMTTFTFAPAVNGVAEVVRVQAEGLAARGYEVTVLTSRLRERSETGCHGNPHVIQFDVSGNGNARVGYRGEIDRYQTFLAEAAPDYLLCHCWESWPTDLAIPVLSKIKARKIMVSHGFSVHRRAPWLPFPRGLRVWWYWRDYVKSLPRMIQAFDRVVFLSPRVDKGRFYDHWVAERAGYPGCVVIPNGADSPVVAPDDIAAFRKTHGIGDRRLVLHVGNYEPNKNQVMALRAFLRADCPESVLLFVGNEINDYARTVMKELHRLPQTTSRRVLFLEKLDRTSLRMAYRAADVLVCSSMTEVQPLVVLDGMAAGLPFVSTDVGCVRDFPGGLVVQGEADMASSLQRILNDPSLRAGLGVAGREACRKTYNWATVLDQYEALFNSIS